MTSLPSAPLQHVLLDLDGEQVGDVRAIDGLAMAADIVSNDLGPNNIAKKHVGNVRFTNAQLIVGLGMGAKMAAWLHDSFAGQWRPVSGSVTLGDAGDRAQSVVSFTNAVPTQVTVPALDASAQDPAALLIQLQPEQVRFGKGDGSAMRGQAMASRPWLCSGFKIEIGTLPCAQVRRIESFTWALALPTDQIGIFREPTKHPAKVTVPDLQLSIAAADFAPWAAAAKSWFIDGHHLEGDEMAGKLSLLAPDGSALASIGLANIGFTSFATLFNPATSGDRFAVGLYVEAMSFDLTPAPAAPGIRMPIKPLAGIATPRG